MSKTLGFKDKWIGKSEFVTKLSFFKNIFKNQKMLEIRGKFEEKKSEIYVKEKV